MFAGELEQNHSMRHFIRKAAEAGMPIYAECGGYMYLMERMTDFNGESHAMAGVIPYTSRMQEKLQMVGYVTAELLEDSVLGQKGDTIRGHEFHFSSESSESGISQRAFEFTRMRNGKKYTAGYVGRNVVGSYLHLHFAGCRKAAECFVKHCRMWKERQA